MCRKKSAAGLARRSTSFGKRSAMMMSEKIVIVATQEQFVEFVVKRLEAITQREESIMEDLSEIKAALSGVKTGMTEMSTAIQNIAMDQDGLLKRIAELEKAIAGGAIV